MVLSERNLKYDETGVGSWYGDEFAGRLAANGEIFDPNKVSTAHKTLPMPSVVRVTNLDNGKSLVVRVNDRGPFVSGRIIDLSREAARLIGYKDSGIAKVRVQILAEQSLQLERLARNGEFPESGFNDEGYANLKCGGKASCKADSKDHQSAGSQNCTWQVSP